MALTSMTAIEIEFGVPEMPVHLAGFYPPRYSMHNHDALKASLMIITKDSDQIVVFGSLDTLFLDSYFHDDLQARLGQRYSLFLVASHTHNAPSLARSMSHLGKVDEGWYHNVLDRLVEGITTYKSEKLTEMGLGSVVTEIVVNRRLDTLQLDYKGLKHGKLRLSKQVAMAPNESGEVDNKLRTVCFKCELGHVRVVIWSLAAHPAFTPSYQSISADFPGRVRSCLKQRYGKDVVSIFLPGLAGSAIPKCQPMSIFKCSLSQIMVRLAPFNKSILPFDDAAYASWSKNVSYHIIGLCDTIDWVPLDSMSCRHIQRPPQTVFTDRNLGEIGLAFKALAFGDTASILLMNGEPLTEWARVFNLRRVSEQPFIVSGYSTGDCLYIPPKYEIMRGGYEVDRFQTFFGLDGEFVCDIDNVMKKEMDGVMRWLAQQKPSPSS